MLYLALSDCAQPPRHVLYHAVDEAHIINTRVGTKTLSEVTSDQVIQTANPAGLCVL
jgi:hypothetical protein